jgi:hypothetical protein
MASSQRVWFLLVEIEGQAFRGTSADKVCLPSDCDVADFRDAVKEKYDRQGDDLKGILSSKLIVYANKAAFDRKDPLQPEVVIGNYGTTGSKLYVVVPEYPSATRLRYFIAPDIQKNVERGVFLIVEGDSNEAGIGMGVFYTPFLAVTCEHNLMPEQTVGCFATIQSGKTMSRFALI